MVNDLDNAARFIERMKELGAVRVSAGDVHVEFGGAELVPVPVSPAKELSEEEREAEYDRLRFLHTEGGLTDG